MHKIILFFFNFPVTTIFSIIMVVIWYYLNHHQVDPGYVAISSNTFLQRKHYWRGISAVFSHYFFFHLFSNLFTHLNYSILELEYGNIGYLKIITLIVVLSPMIDCLIRKIFNLNRDLYCVGYSYVLFGLSPLLYKIINECSLFGFYYPCIINPFVDILISQLIFPISSFIAHLSGIIVGFAIYFDLFKWFSNTMFCTIFPFLIAFYLYSYWKTKPKIHSITVQIWKNNIFPLLWGKI